METSSTEDTHIRQAHSALRKLEGALPIASLDHKEGAAEAILHLRDFPRGPDDIANTAIERRQVDLLGEIFRAVSQNGVRHVRVDMGELQQSCSSALLGQIVTLWKRLGKDGNVTLFNVSSDVRHVLERTKLNTLFAEEETPPASGNGDTPEA